MKLYSVPIVLLLGMLAKGQTEPIVAEYRLNGNHFKSVQVDSALVFKVHLTRILKQYFTRLIRCLLKIFSVPSMQAQAARTVVTV